MCMFSTAHLLPESLPSLPPLTARSPLLTVQAGFTHSLVGSARLGHTLAQVAGFAALATVGIQVGRACFLGTSEGHLGIGQSEGQNGNRRGRAGIRCTPPNIFYWNHLGWGELSRQASGTSKLVGQGWGSARQGREAGGGQHALQTARWGQARGSDTNLLQISSWKWQLPPGIFRTHYMGTTAWAEPSACYS